MDREWLSFLREQYPKGSRIILHEMNDPYAPIESGMTGTLDCIDDIGTFHVKWDNGRSLGVVVGEDRFTIRPPRQELTTLKLYMPLTASLYAFDESGDLDNESVEVSGSELVNYQHMIQPALMKYRSPEESERGIMHWYGKTDGVNDKVQSVVFNVENRNDRLWGVAECRIYEPLLPAELETLKDYISGQASDGWGEGFEQHEILTGEGELYVHLWDFGKWSIMTEQERFAPKVAEGLPELCFSTLKSTGELIIIRRGESGYYRSDCNSTDRTINEETANENNQKLGVTAAQRCAMEAGSMFGWNVPGADPANYEQKENHRGMRGMTLG